MKIDYQMIMFHGIYCILNKINNKRYIGSTKRFPSRCLNHRCKLRNNKHDNKLLQIDYNKYGENNFEFQILEHINVPTNSELFWGRNCKERDFERYIEYLLINKQEQVWIDYFSPNIYNTCNAISKIYNRNILNDTYKTILNNHSKKDIIIKQLHKYGYKIS